MGAMKGFTCRRATASPTAGTTKGRCRTCAIAGSALGRI